MTLSSRGRTVVFRVDDPHARPAVTCQVVGERAHCLAHRLRRIAFGRFRALDPIRFKLDQQGFERLVAVGIYSPYSSNRMEYTVRQRITPVDAFGQPVHEYAIAAFAPLLTNLFGRVDAGLVARCGLLLHSVWNL